MAKKVWDIMDAMPADHEFEIYHPVTVGDATMPTMHVHTHYELYIYVSGNVNIAVEDQLYVPEPYALFIYPPGIMHRCISRPDIGRYERIYTYVTRECIESMSTPEFPMMRIIDLAVTGQIYSFQLGAQVGRLIVDQMDEVIRNYQQDDPADVYLNRCRYQMALATICRQLTSATQGTHTAPSRMRDIISYINDHLTEPLTLDDLAEHFYVSKYYLLHSFKEYANMSVRQFIINKRLIRAQALMREGTPPGDAARLSGFNDYAGFYRAFVKQTGVSPQAFVKGGKG